MGIGIFLGVALAFFLFFAPAILILRSDGPSLILRAFWALLSLLPIPLLYVLIEYSDVASREYLRYTAIANVVGYATAWLVLLIFKKKISN